MKGLYNKYTVRRVEGTTDPEAQYFVLRIDTDLHAQKALEAYLNLIKDTNPTLAEDLRFWLLEVRNE